MEKTHTQLEEELLSKTKSNENLKKRISILTSEVLRHKAVEKTLIRQYEQIVLEWKKMYENLLTNGWKIVFVKIVEKYNKLRR